MKFRTKLVGVVLTGAACLGLSAAPAFAATGALALVGQTTSLTPVQLQGGGGTFVFADVTAGPAHACVVVSTTASGECSANSNGAYVNIVCGTGSVTAGASATLTGVVGVNAGASITITYGITFAAGVGVLTGTDGGNTVVAAVDILPTGGNCVSGVTQFTATVAGADA